MQASPVQEIAAELRIPVGTATALLTRGRRRLRAALQDGQELR